MDFLRIFAANMKQELLEISRQLAEITERLNNLITKMAENSEDSEVTDNSECADSSECTDNSECIESDECFDDSEISEPTVTAASPAKPIQFTLNDRYRFLREIFGNSVQEMADAITELEQMNSAEEVTTYAIHTLGLNPEQQIAKDFLAAVTERFNDRPTLLA